MADLTQGQLIFAGIERPGIHTFFLIGPLESVRRVS